MATKLDHYIAGAIENQNNKRMKQNPMVVS